MIYYITLKKVIQVENFFAYNAKTNNCQRFIYNILKYNDLLTNKYENFVLQDSLKILEKTPIFNNILNVSTLLAEKGDIILQGGSTSNYSLSDSDEDSSVLTPLE